MFKTRDGLDCNVSFNSALRASLINNCSAYAALIFVSSSLLAFGFVAISMDSSNSGKIILRVL